MGFGIDKNTHAVDELKERIETLSRDIERGEVRIVERTAELADDKAFQVELRRVRDEYQAIADLARNTMYNIESPADPQTVAQQVITRINRKTYDLEGWS